MLNLMHCHINFTRFGRRPSHRAELLHLAQLLFFWSHLIFTTTLFLNRQLLSLICPQPFLNDEQPSLSCHPTFLKPDYAMDFLAK